MNGLSPSGRPETSAVRSDRIAEIVGLRAATVDGRLGDNSSMRVYRRPARGMSSRQQRRTAQWIGT
ncbi:hypothetical protein YT1_4810 [Rhodococcus ruber]|nr:hypothetical protein YT1_4810 [Rhodococcus ruber]